MAAINPTAAVGGGGGGVAEEEPMPGLEALRRLGSTSPPLYLSPSAEIARLARDASKHIFYSLLPFCPPNSLPLDRLLADEGFDAEQIWHQIELQARPLVSGLKRDVRRFEKKMNLGELFGGLVAKREGEGNEVSKERGVGEDGGEDGAADMEGDEDEEGNEGEVEEEGEEEEDEREEEEKEGEEEEDEREEEEKEGEEQKEEGGGVEDRFLKIKELEEYMEKDEAREYGAKDGGGEREVEEEEDDEDGDEEEGGKEQKFVNLYAEDDDDGGDGSGAYIKYDDFFGGKKKKTSQTGDIKKKRRSSEKLDSVEGLEDFDSHDEDMEPIHPSDTDDDQNDDEHFSSQNAESLSKYERQQKKLQSKIEQLEKENLGPKPWTMTGEVTAAKRPKNSALEVDLVFQHNKGRYPGTTVEATALVEDIILQRIREGRTDEVQKAPTLPSKAPKELKDLDENKSKKGLAEIYEEEYAQKTSLVLAPLSFSDEQKKETSLLFKKICLKLDALSHFHFTPKPVIEDISIQANVPALAMEEIAPLAVSDAAMLAPEEIFSGRGDIKEETELTQADRRRRRANKKRKFKAAATTKRAAYKARQNADARHPRGKEDSRS